MLRAGTPGFASMRFTMLLRRIRFRSPPQIWIFSLLGFHMASALALAGDKTWDNGAGTFIWNTADLNWTGTAWNNAAGDGAIFGVTGAGTINVPAGIFVNSFNFTSASNYIFNGA